MQIKETKKKQIETLLEQWINEQLEHYCLNHNINGEVEYEYQILWNDPENNYQDNLQIWFWWRIEEDEEERLIEFYSESNSFYISDSR